MTIIQNTQDKVDAGPWSFRGVRGLSDAEFSVNLKYRYKLGRIWDTTAPALIFVGLNPSTADFTKDDPTIRRILGFAMDWGLGALHMLNLFAWRSTDRRVLKDRVAVPDPVGPVNDRAIAEVFEWGKKNGARLLLGWGNDGAIDGRDIAVRRMAREIHGRPEALHLTNNQQPGHPLYLAASLRPFFL